MDTSQETKPMELEGSLKAFRFPEILQFLAMGNMTGMLTVDRRDQRVSLTFKEGKIIGASCRERSGRLGQMLVYAGKLSRHALEETLEFQEHDPGDKRLGEILVSRGMIEAEEVETTLRLQIEEEIWELFSWDNGNFRFEQGEVSEGGPITISLDVEPLLLEGSRRTDEWQTICANIGEGEEVFGVNPEIAGTPESPLDENTWQVLSLVNGQLPVDAIVRLSNLGKFETYWALDHLVRSEIIVPATGSDEADPSAAASGAGPTEGLGDASGSESPSPAGSREASGGDKTGFLGLGLFGRKKNASHDEGESEYAASGSGDSAVAPGREYSTDVGLVCAAVNHLIDRLKGESSFVSDADPPDAIQKLWAQALDRFPKADLIRFHDDRLSPVRFERYAELEGGITEALRGTHDDGLEALKCIWELLIARAAERLDQSAAKQIGDKAIRPYLQCTPKAQAADFSLVRWKEDAT